MMRHSEICFACSQVEESRKIISHQRFEIAYANQRAAEKFDAAREAQGEKGKAERERDEALARLDLAEQIARKPKEQQAEAYLQLGRLALAMARSASSFDYLGASRLYFAQSLILGRQEAKTYLYYLQDDNYLFNKGDQVFLEEGVDAHVSNISLDGKFFSSSQYWTIYVRKLGEKDKTITIAPKEDRGIIYPGFVFSSDGKRGVSLRPEEITVWNLDSFKKERTIEFSDGSITSAAISPDGKIGISAECNGQDKNENCTKTRLKLWDMNSGKVLKTFNGDGKGAKIYRLIFSPTGSRALSCGGDFFQLWNVETGQRLRQFNNQGFRYTANRVVFSPEGRYIASGHDGTIDIFSAQDGSTIGNIRSFAGYVGPFQFTPDGKFIVASGCDEYDPNNSGCHQAALRVWNTESKELELSINIGDTPGYDISFSPNGKYFLLQKDVAHLWQTSDWSPLMSFFWDNIWAGPVERHYQLTRAFFSSDGKSIIFSYVIEDGTAEVQSWPFREDFIHQDAESIYREAERKTWMTLDGFKIIPRPEQSE